MAEIADISDFINLSTGGGAAPAQPRFWWKGARSGGAAATAPVAGRMTSLWRYDGQPGGGAVPTTVAAPDNTFTGALPFTSPGGGRQAWMTQAWATGLNAGTLILYDRLLHIGGLSGTVVSPTAQTVGGALTRHTNGVGNIIFAEIYTQIGASTAAITASYTDQDGNSGQTSVATQIGNTGFRDVSRIIPLALAAGDTGVQAVASVTLSVTTGTPGNFGITVGHPLAYVGIGGPGAPGWRDFLTGMPGIPEIEPGACLALLWVPVTAAAPDIFGGHCILEK